MTRTTNTRGRAQKKNETGVTFTSKLLHRWIKRYRGNDNNVNVAMMNQANDSLISVQLNNASNKTMEQFSFVLSNIIPNEDVALKCLAMVSLIN